MVTTDAEFVPLKATALPTPELDTMELPVTEAAADDDVTLQAPTYSVVELPIRTEAAPLPLVAIAVLTAELDEMIFPSAVVMFETVMTIHCMA